MIIFDLDGTLADCEHRRHFVEPNKAGLKWGGIEGNYNGNWTKDGVGLKWQPDWRAFYDACDKDEPIKPLINVFESFVDSSSVEGCVSECFDIEIWSGRCESVRNKTEKWLEQNVWGAPFKLKMRPIGNSEPDEVLKERWLDEALSEGNQIDFVFDSYGPSIKMWKRRGIFVFNCAQDDNEF